MQSEESPAPTDVTAPVVVPTNAPTTNPIANPSGTSPGTLVTVGDNGGPSFPLGHCEADCDDDDECESDLVCYQRGSDDDPTPGCIGVPDGKKDYCVRLEDIPPMLTDVGDNYEDPSTFPLGLCEGDCDGDSGELAARSMIACDERYCKGF